MSKIRIEFSKIAYLEDVKKIVSNLATKSELVDIIEKIDGMDIKIQEEPIKKKKTVRQEMEDEDENEDENDNKDLKSESQNKGKA